MRNMILLFICFRETQFPKFPLLQLLKLENCCCLIFTKGRRKNIEGKRKMLMLLTLVEDKNRNVVMENFIIILLKC